MSAVADVQYLMDIQRIRHNVIKVHSTVPVT